MFHSLKPQTEIFNFFLFRLQHVCLINYRIHTGFGLLVYSQEIISSARPPTSDSRSPDLQHASLSIPSCHVSSLRGTDGHCDCLGWFQQHLPMGANEQVPPEVDTVTRHRAQEHAGTNDQAGLSDRDEALNEMRQDLVLVLITTFGPGPRSASYSTESIPSSCSR